jgi:serine protease Do
MLDELQTAVATVTARVGPSTVTIGRDRRGTGVVVADGRILTNAHNLRDRTTQVAFADGRTAQAEVLGADPEGDLAVLAVDTSGAAVAEWSASPAAAGQVVFGVARGRQGLRVTFGVVSGVDREFRGPRGRRITGSVEHTAPLARGSSGGPLVDADGRLLGINTNRLGDGFYLAIPTDAGLRDRVDRLAAGHSPTRRRLGVAVAPSFVARRLRRSVGLPDRDGLLVRGVDDGSPAAAGGVTAGDLIVSANGVAVHDTDDLWSVLDALGGGDEDTVDLGIVRGAEELTIRVTFANGATATEEGSA